VRPAWFPLVALVTGAAGVAAAWARPRWDGVARPASIAVGGALATGIALWIALGWRAAAAALLGGVLTLVASRLAGAAAPGLAVAALGVTAMSLMSFGYDAASWRATGGTAGALAAGAVAAVVALRAARQLEPNAERAALATVALVAPILVATLDDSVANRPDAVALAVTYGAAIVAAGAVGTAMERVAAVGPTRRIAQAALAIIGCWWTTGSFDPVLLTPAGAPLAPRAAFPAVAAGLVAGAALPWLGSLSGARLANGVTLVAVAVTLLGAGFVAGAFGIAVAGTALVLTAEPPSRPAAESVPLSPSPAADSPLPLSPSAAADSPLPLSPSPHTRRGGTTDELR
jgi:hypothetical protein